MPTEIIQWFPGHMAKTRRMISENLKNADAVIDVRDARIPKSSENPEIKRLTEGKPRLILLNKASLADPEQSALWMQKLTSDGVKCILTDCNSGDGIKRISEALKELCAQKLQGYESKGMNGRKLRVMVLGIPNVGKSSLINKLAGGGKTKVENRPGVTRDKQWVTTSLGIDLLDMPGVLWPRFDDRKTAENLAITGAIKDQVVDTEELSAVLLARLRSYYPSSLCERFKLTPEDISEEVTNSELFERIARKRGLIVRGGEINTERCAAMLLEEFRSAKIGRITLDRI